MKLSTDDIRMVEKLRRRQQSFRRWRLLSLFVFGLLFIGISIAWLFLSAQLSHLTGITGDDSIAISTKAIAIATKAAIVAYMFPVIILSLVCSAFGFGYTLSIWRGEPKTELLLRLIDELHKQDV
jgi:hypothetical protein